MKILLQAQNVTKDFSGYKALSDVSLDVPAQSIYGLLGPNGAGKTTFIRIINQITAPDSGKLFINGERLSQKHTESIGYLPEERGLYRKMLVGDQALYLARLKGLSHHEARTRLITWFKKFDILHWWNKKVEELSKGMQQKIQFIVTVIHNPALLIFDEPFSGFDPINVNLLKDEILQLRDKGATIIFSTHNMASVEELCDNIALINKSEKILEGSVHEIKQLFKTHTFEVTVKSFSSENENLLPDHFMIRSDSSQNGVRTLQVSLNEGESPNDLINSLLPHADILSFREIFPTMNEIFISKIKEYNT